MRKILFDKRFYNKNGFFLLNNFFDKKEIHNILCEAKEIFIQQFIFRKYIDKKINISEEEFNKSLYRLFRDDIQCFINCGKQTQHLISLHRLSTSKKIISLLKDVGLDFPVICTRPVLYFNHPNLATKKVFYKVDAHQDWRSMQGSLNSVVIWVPLIDIDKSLGALEVIPGSHLWGLITNHIEHGFGMVKLSDDDEKKFIALEVKQGDALIFSSFLVHRSGNNITDSPRWSCHFRYNDAKEQSFIERAYAHPYIYKPQEELITPDFPQIQHLEKIFDI